MELVPEDMAGDPVVQETLRALAPQSACRLQRSVTTCCFGYHVLVVGAAWFVAGAFSVGLFPRGIWASIARGRKTYLVGV